MYRKRRFFGFGIILTIVFAFMGGQFALAHPLAQEPEVTISELKGPERSEYIGSTVIVEGIFIRDPLPMLVTDLDVVLANTPMPEEQYILLAGDEAKRMDPQEIGGAQLRVTGEVNVESDESDVEQVYLVVLEYEIVFVVEPYTPYIVEYDFSQWLNPDPTRYAILFSGGVSAANNHLRYWNDLTFMYGTLVNRLGFPPEHIAVLYADGTARDTQMPVDYAATPDNLQTAFDLLRDVSTDRDMVFFFTTNHGSGFDEHTSHYTWGGELDTNGSEPGSDLLWENIWSTDLNGDGDQDDIVSWDEELNAWGNNNVSDDDFAALFDGLAYDTMIIVMEQCFSGGLIYDMRGDNRIIMSAAGEFEFSWGGQGPASNFDEFSYHLTSALNWADHLGNSINADANNDSHVSMVEAFNYARAKDMKPETPWYEDSGDGQAHMTSYMPTHDDGVLGNSTFLD